MCEKIVKNNCKIYFPIGLTGTNCPSCKYWGDPRCRIQGTLVSLFEVLDRGNNRFVERMIRVGMVEDISKVLMEAITKKEVKPDVIDWENSAVVWMVTDEKKQEAGFLWDTDIVELKDADEGLQKELEDWMKIQPVDTLASGEKFDSALNNYRDFDGNALVIERSVFPIPKD